MLRWPFTLLPFACLFALLIIDGQSLAFLTEIDPEQTAAPPDDPPEWDLRLTWLGVGLLVTSAILLVREDDAAYRPVLLASITAAALEAASLLMAGFGVSLGDTGDFIFNGMHGVLIAAAATLAYLPLARDARNLDNRPRWGAAAASIATIVAWVALMRFIPAEGGPLPVLRALAAAAMLGATCTVAVMLWNDDE